VLVGARHFETMRKNANARAFLDGAGPAAIGAIFGVAIPLALALQEGWQYIVLAGAAISLLLLRRSVVLTLLVAAAVGIVVVQAGAPLP
jgi:chromate transporter